MLSYQHLYHAGNLADVQKHALLAWMLEYLTQKDKPLSYIETHAGRGLYDLSSAEALKTGEAEKGIGALSKALPSSHPYARALARIRSENGPHAYPGSPLIAATLLRPQDQLHLAELHPQEHAALRQALRAPNVSIRRQDGFELAQSLCPPEPRRGLLLVDPSYEVKQDYDRIPKFLSAVAKKWNVGVLALWYPILTSGLHAPMLQALSRDHPEALRHEVRFPPIREGHRMVGSGLFVINPPWGLADEARRLDALFSKAKKR
jgi:23S rRNA (adenine2030-N6)-methyltransferase